VKITVIIDSTSAVDKLRKLVDLGRFTEAQAMSSMFDGFAEQVKSLVQTKGGHINVMLYERQVLEVTESTVEDLYTILEGYKNVMGKDIAVGIGLDFNEARRACKVSRTTKKIEFFEPGSDQEQIKQSGINDDEKEVELSPNLTDVEKPDPPPPTKKSKQAADKKVILRPSFEEESAEEQQAQAQQEQAQMQEQMQEQQQAAPQQDPREQQVQEALRGQQTQKEEIEPDVKTELDPQTAEPAEAIQPEDKRAEKLVALLANVKGHLPDIMKLHDTNPEAFKQAMGMIAKLTSIAKSEEARDLIKALGRPKITWPIGTVLGRKKKVANGRWRSLGAGQVQDGDGNAISVKSHNAKADDPGQQKL
jgi:hypothetical protein